MMKPIERLSGHVHRDRAPPVKRDIILRLRDPEWSDACLEDERAMLDAADEIERLREVLRAIAVYADYEDVGSPEIRAIANIAAEALN